MFDRIVSKLLKLGLVSCKLPSFSSAQHAAWHFLSGSPLSLSLSVRSLLPHGLRFRDVWIVLCLHHFGCELLFFVCLFVCFLPVNKNFFSPPWDGELSDSDQYVIYGVLSPVHQYLSYSPFLTAHNHSQPASFTLLSYRSPKIRQILWSTRWQRLSRISSPKTPKTTRLRTLTKKLEVLRMMRILTQMR